ncbi:hypothetical protein ACOSQ2_007550 [Xanthoceras sorbifolium]
MAPQVNRHLVQAGLEGYGDIDRIYANQNYYDQDHDHQYPYNIHHHGNHTEAAQYYDGLEFKEYYYTRKAKSSSFFSLKRFGLGF